MRVSAREGRVTRQREGERGRGRSAWAQKRIQKAQLREEELERAKGRKQTVTAIVVSASLELNSRLKSPSCLRLRLQLPPSLLLPPPPLLLLESKQTRLRLSSHSAGFLLSPPAVVGLAALAPLSQHTLPLTLCHQHQQQQRQEHQELPPHTQRPPARQRVFVLCVCDQSVVCV